MTPASLEPKKIETLYGTSLSSLQDNLHDHSYFFEKTNENEATLLIMIALPPFSKVLVNELDVALQLQSSHRRRDCLPAIFDRSDVLPHYFTEDTYQEAVVAEHKLQGERIVGRSVYFADVKLTELQLHKKNEITFRGKQLLSTHVNLFNSLCRDISKKYGIPFISSSDTSAGFVISKGNGAFHDAFREPCSYINLMSFVHFLKYKKLLFTKDEVISFLP